MDKTIDRVVAASKLPLSIVIVGVGSADFTNMVSATLFVCASAHTHTHLLKCACPRVHCVVFVGKMVLGFLRSFQETLDADDNPLVDKRGTRMSRDIVQFVPLREFKTRSSMNFSLVCMP